MKPGIPLAVVVLLSMAGCDAAQNPTAPAAPQFNVAPADFLVPPGAFTGEVAIDGTVVSLVFAGNPALRINRVITSSGVDIEFAGASPIDATRFFRDNPLPASTSVTIRVTNPTDRPLRLIVTSHENNR